jgi:tetratricopeptide (TPR) repeat protein
LHNYARQLQAENKNEEAMKIFELNAKRHPNTWPVQFGLARGHAGLGHKEEAVRLAREAQKQAPDEAARQNVENFIRQLEGSSK